MNWVTAEAVREGDQQLPIRQIYVWYLTSDKNFLLVSKDGENWQLPGGKPDAGESFVETAVREMKEETGVSIDDIVSGLKFFGYYLVIKQEDDGSETKFLQIRFYLHADVASDILNLSAKGEDTVQVAEDQIMHVRAVTTNEAKNLIPWLAVSGEYKELEAQGLI